MDGFVRLMDGLGLGISADRYMDNQWFTDLLYSQNRA